MDRELLLAVNGSDSLYLDRVVRTLTNGLAWIPLYLSMFYLVLKNNDNFRRLLFLLGGVALCYLLSGAIDDGIVKPLVARWRPTHDPQIGTLVDVVDGYRGGNYGFFSAHACNTMSIATYFCWIVRSRRLNMVACKLLDPSLSWCPFPWRHPCWSHLGCNRRHWRLFPLQSINPWHVYAS